MLGYATGILHYGLTNIEELNNISRSGRRLTQRWEQLIQLVSSFHFKTLRQSSSTKIGLQGGKSCPRVAVPRCKGLVTPLQSANQTAIFCELARWPSWIFGFADIVKFTLLLWPTLLNSGLKERIRIQPQSKWNTHGYCIETSAPSRSGQASTRLWIHSPSRFRSLCNKYCDQV